MYCKYVFCKYAVFGAIPHTTGILVSVHLTLFNKNKRWSNGYIHTLNFNLLYSIHCFCLLLALVLLDICNTGNVGLLVDCGCLTAVHHRVQVCQC